MGSKVSDYKTKIIKEDSVEWHWKSIKEIEKDLAVIKAYEKILQFRNVKQADRVDKLIWHLYSKRDQKWAKILYNKYLNVKDPTSIFRSKSLPKGFES